ncbi:MAG: ABC transporter ATP-binding protein [Candidatus Synoicihabitans palmerolidicus]|nr:ABC transporter ATP-binding protein [Candidatus Synoicihabitans palmerolidicus]
MDTSEQIPVLAASGLTKSFASGERTLQVLRGVDLSVAAGETVSIRGESGSGKSTLLHLLAGLDAIDGGSLRWGGVEDTGASRRGRFLGLVFQSFYLIPELTALDNVLMAARMLGRIGAVARERAEVLLGRVGLAERASHVPTKLSGGERQRVAVARALMNRPKLLLADEPTGNLDERTGDAVIELLLELSRETDTALVLVTHNPGHAAKTDRQLVLTAGRLGDESD